MTPPESYHHRQVGWVTVVALGLTFLVVVSALLFLPRGVATFAVVVIALVMVEFGSFTVTIDREALECRFGPGPIRRRIPLAQIDSARPVRNRWWYGWGIRWYPGGWLWNVSGLDAVELELTGGRRFRVGTDEPQALAAALEAALARRA